MPELCSMCGYQNRCGIACYIRPAVQLRPLCGGIGGLWRLAAGHLLLGPLTEDLTGPKPPRQQGEQSGSAVYIQSYNHGMSLYKATTRPTVAH